MYINILHLYKVTWYSLACIQILYGGIIFGGEAQKGNYYDKDTNIMENNEVRRVF